MNLCGCKVPDMCKCHVQQDHQTLTEEGCNLVTLVDVHNEAHEQSSSENRDGQGFLSQRKTHKNDP